MSSRRRRAALTWIAAATLGLAAAPGAGARGRRGAAGALAQQLVESVIVQHGEVREASIVAQTPRGCFNVASTDPGDLGEACEADDRVPLETGKADVGKEEGGYAVSLPLRDRGGERVAALGVEFRRGAYSKPDEALAAARAIAASLEPRVPSKAALLAPATPAGGRR